MNVKDQIKQCPRLTEEQKADALARIERIENDPVERKDCRYLINENAEVFCAWGSTKDGYNYWKYIYNEIYNR